jgi:acyl-CoA thioesterase II
VNTPQFPLPYRIRVRAGDEVLAESAAAVALPDEAGRPVVWLPRGDVTPAGAGFLLHSEDAAGLVSFDPPQVTAEIVDGRDGDDPRDVTVKRFPAWGDARDLIEILDVQPDGPGRFVSKVSGDRAGHVEGSQMLGQSVVAAGRTAPGRRVVSAHMAFFRPADPREPLEFELEALSSGRTMTALAVRVVQSGRARAAGTLLLDTPSPDLIRHQAPAPDCPGPYESVPYDMSVVGRDVRVVDAAYNNDPNAPVGPPVIDTWIRFRDVPDDEYLHAGLLVQFMGHMSIAAAMRPHAGIGQAQAHRDFSTGINGIAVSLHADVRADEWMRYHHHSTFAGSGITHSECRAYAEDGTVLASFSVDAMVRPFPADGPRRL